MPLAREQLTTVGLIFSGFFNCIGVMMSLPNWSFADARPKLSIV